MIQEVLKGAIDYMRENFVIENMRSPRIVEHAPDPSGKESYILGIYLASPSGEVFNFNESDNSYHITICFDCVLSSDPRLSGEEIVWMDKLIEIMRTHDFAISNGESLAVSTRADLGYPYNGFAMALDCTVAYSTDGLY